MPNCVYFKCGNSTRTVGEHVSFHRLPVEESCREIWLAKMGVPDCKQRFAHVCSNHFRETDLIRVKRGSFLCPDAEPIQFCYVQGLSSSETEISTAECSDLNNLEMEQFIDLASYSTVGASQTTSEVKLPNQHIHKDHNYCRRTFCVNFRSSAYTNRRKISQLRKNIYCLRKEVKLVRKESSKRFKPFINYDGLPEFVQQFVSVVLKHFNKGRPKQYSPEMRQFALTLHYYSPTAYNYVREKFSSCLPCDQTIRNWYRTVNGKPGFSDTALSALQTLQQQTPYQIVGCISVDGMHLRKHLQSDGTATSGYVDFGGVIETDKRQLANEALNIMFAGLNVPVKQPLGYFFINGIGSRQLNSLLAIGRQLVYDCGIMSATISYDGLSSNFSMSKTQNLRIISECVPRNCTITCS